MVDEGECAFEVEGEDCWGAVGVILCAHVRFRIICEVECSGEFGVLYDEVGLVVVFGVVTVLVLYVF